MLLEAGPTNSHDSSTIQLDTLHISRKLTRSVTRTLSHACATNNRPNAIEKNIVIIGRAATTQTTLPRHDAFQRYIRSYGTTGGSCEHGERAISVFQTGVLRRNEGGEARRSGNSVRSTVAFASWCLVVENGNTNWSVGGTMNCRA